VLGGEGIVDQVAADLRAEFPSLKGLSRSNVMYMRAFAQAWPGPAFVQQPVGQIPWGHNLVLLTKLKEQNARLAYAASALEHGWSRAVWVHPIEARTVERRGKALTNFEQHLPKPQSDLARENLPASSPRVLRRLILGRRVLDTGRSSVVDLPSDRDLDTAYDHLRLRARHALSRSEARRNRASTAAAERSTFVSSLSRGRSEPAKWLAARKRASIATADISTLIDHRPANSGCQRYLAAGRPVLSSR
jgi:predicted nuclease of restriction endonuclease-like (RecB) superfamily